VGIKFNVICYVTSRVKDVSDIVPVFKFSIEAYPN